MANKILVLFLGLIMACPLSTMAQLSDKAIDEIADKHVEKWTEYLNLSSYRKADLKNIWKKHERKKSSIFHSTNNLKDRLAKENQNFLTELSKILTPNEIKVYKMIEDLKIQDDREYLGSLLKAISSDSVFVEAYTDLQYNKIFPFNMLVRMELEESISSSDKIVLDSIRNEVFEMYDKCLLTCLLKGHHENELFEQFDELLIVSMNRDLNDSQSNISKLVKLTNKYEDAIHDIYIDKKANFDYLDKKIKELKDQYILESHNQSLLEIRKNNDLSILKHIESEAIFLLLDPYDHHLSRKIFNLDLYNKL